MKLHVTLKYGSFERSFFVSCDHDHQTFTWLAKVVFHRYTIFVPEIDKIPPPHMQLHTKKTDSVDDKVVICPRTFCPPIDAYIIDFVKDGDLATCCLENNPQSDSIRMRFYLKYAGETPPGRTYITLSRKKQQELCSEFKMNRFHQFQNDNQRKLAQYISAKTKLLSTTSTTLNSPRHTSHTGENGRPSPGKILKPRPPAHTCHVSNKFRRRAEEKAILRANNQPIYDYDPDLDDESDLFGDLPGYQEDAGDEEEEHEGGDLVETTADELRPASRDRGRSIVTMTSRQVSMHLRRKSTLRTSSINLHNSAQNSRRTDIRQTLQELFRARAERAGNQRTSSMNLNIPTLQTRRGSNDKTRYVLKPNGPISKDIMWRQRALASGGLALPDDAKFRSGSNASVNSRMTIMEEDGD